jgi:hypothetical protein
MQILNRHFLIVCSPVCTSYKYCIEIVVFQDLCSHTVTPEQKGNKKMALPVYSRNMLTRSTQKCSPC